MSDAGQFARKLFTGAFVVFAWVFVLRVILVGCGVGSDLVLPAGDYHTVITGALLAIALGLLTLALRKPRATTE